MAARASAVAPSNAPEIARCGLVSGPSRYTTAAAASVSPSTSRAARSVSSERFVARCSISMPPSSASARLRAGRRAEERLADHAGRATNPFGAIRPPALRAFVSSLPGRGEDRISSPSNAALGRSPGWASSILHTTQNLVLAPFADEAVVLARLGEAEPGEVPDQHQHEDDGDVVGHRYDRPEVLQRSHAPSAGLPCTRALRRGQCRRARDAANRRTREGAP